ncbi:hypothetical protein [Vitreimonas flagellata]|uniref:hypothetical protein n=1 Tax=Vitreimonas flagellata TaxID=2560861 RepID=UPI001075009F|nr:hypothetical protein [Vitreimonas flagellata]
MTTLMGGNTTFQKRARGSTRTAFSPSWALGEVVARQRDRWILWLAAALIVGAALWLLAQTDPPWWLGLAVFVPSAAAAIGLAIWPSETADGWDARLRTVPAALFALLAFAGLGAGAAQLRTSVVTQAPSKADSSRSPPKDGSSPTTPTRTVLDCGCWRVQSKASPSRRATSASPSPKLAR